MMRAKDSAAACKVYYLPLFIRCIYAVGLPGVLPVKVMNRIFGASASRKPKPTLQDAISSVSKLSLCGKYVRLSAYN